MAASLKNESQVDPKLTIEEVATQYETVLTLNFEKQENALVQELYDHAKELKRELAVFRREVGQENIERLIADRRREKEKERQVLESRWRECNEGYKALQEEQKRLVNEHRENLFDVKNLQAKIKDFQQQLDHLKERVAALENENSGKFMTETKDFQLSFEKGSKLFKTINEVRKLTIPSRLKNDENSQSIDPYLPNQSKTTKQKTMLQSINLTQYSNAPTNLLFTKHKSSASALNLSKLNSKTANQLDANQLDKFMECPRIRQKIFDALQREI